MFSLLHRDPMDFTPPTFAAAEALDAPGPGKVRAVLDTDTFNEVDDQFALAHMLFSPDRIDLEAVTAAPFFNPRSTSPGDGMVKSHDEILRVLELANPPARPPVLRGATEYLSASGSPRETDATRAIIDFASERDDERPLYVVAIGAPTNVAAALALAPEIASRIVVVWLGGHAPDWPVQDEFNWRQDPRAVETLFRSGVPLVQVPCLPVASHLVTTVAELDAALGDGSALCRFLVGRVREYGEAARAGALDQDVPLNETARKSASAERAWSKVIWDIAASAWLVNSAWLPSRLERTALPGEAAPAGDGPVFRRVLHVDRDAIFGDVFEKLRAHG